MEDEYIDPVTELRSMLDKNGMKQREFAALAGVSEQHISYVLNGQRKAGEKILKVLGIEKVTGYRFKNG